MEERTPRRTRPRLWAQDGESLALGLVALSCLVPCAAPLLRAGLAATGLALGRTPLPWPSATGPGSR